MTVQELIDNLSEMGDENWRNAAKVRILDRSGALIDEPDQFGLKFASTSLDITMDVNFDCEDSEDCDECDECDDDWEDDLDE